MKRLNSILFLFFISVSILGCIKNDEVTYTGMVAEIDQTTYNANAAGLNYPILVRIPAMGRAVAAVCPDSTLRRFSGTIRLRINLVGSQSSKEETVGFKTFTRPTVAGQLLDSTAFPATLGFSCQIPLPNSSCRQSPLVNAAPFSSAPVDAPNTKNSCLNDLSRLAVVDAVAGTHYNITSAAGKVTIPANSSFGYIDIQILNSAPSVRSAAFLGIELDATGSLKPNENYKQIGLLIDQRATDY